MANFNELKFLIGSNLATAQSSSASDGNVYIVANNDVDAGSGAIVINGHTWYEAANGITAVAPFVSGNTLYLKVTERNGTGVTTTDLVLAHGVAGSAVTTTFGEDAETSAITLSSEVQLETASTFTDGGIQLLSITDDNKLDASVKLAYTPSTGKLSIANKAGEKSEISLPLESFIENGVFVKTQAEYTAWAAEHGYDEVAATISEPSLVLILHTTEDEEGESHTADTAIVIPSASIFQLYDVTTTTPNSISVSSSTATDDSTKNITTTFTVDLKVSDASGNGLTETENGLFVDTTKVENIIDAVGLTDDGTHATQAGTNYISSATTIEGEIVTLDKVVGLLDELVATMEESAGLEEDGSYSPNTATTYVSGATSLKDADTKLDTALAELAAKVDKNAVSGADAIVVTVPTDETGNTVVSLTLDNETKTEGNALVTLSQSEEGLNAQVGLDNTAAPTETSKAGGIGLTQGTDGKIKATMYWGTF